MATKRKKQCRSLTEIFSNLKLRRLLEDFVTCINERKAFPAELLSEINELRFQNIGHFIPQKSPNISNEATESLVCHLINRRMILKRISYINSVELRGHRKGAEGGADIVVNGNIKVEVKGTSVKRDITTKAKSNQDVFALVWVETEDWMKHKLPYINIKVFYYPHGIDVEHLKSNGEDKIRLHKSFEKMKENGLVEEVRINVEELQEEQFKDATLFFNINSNGKKVISPTTPIAVAVV
jgi:hypothetical protein